MSGELIINGIDIGKEYGVRIGAVHPYAAVGNPEAAVQIPGRVGLLVQQRTIELGGYQWPVWPDGLPNEIREYNVGIYTHRGNSRSNNAVLETKMADIRQMLLYLPSRWPEIYWPQVLTIEDSYEPGVYREGVLSGDFSPIRKGAGNNFEAILRFSLDPRRFIAGDYTRQISQLSEAFSAQDVGSPWADRIKTLARPKITIDGMGDLFSLEFKEGLDSDPYGQVDFNAFTGTVELDTNDMTVVSRGGATNNGEPFINDVEGECYLLPTGCVVERSPGAVYVSIDPRWWVR